MAGRSRGKEVKGKKTKDKPKCQIYIFSEGETEQIYLQHFENRTYNVEVVPVDPEHTDALGIVRFAKQYINVHKMDLDFGDRAYCVFDADPASNPKKQLKEAFDLLKGYREKGLECIFSNPGFEVWFVLHFKNAPYGLSAQQMKDEIKRLLKKDFPDYSETTDIYPYLQEKQPGALKRARLLHTDQEKVHAAVLSHECNPYTNIFEFIDYMEEIKKTHF